jgi:hypothetical protein
VDRARYSPLREMYSSFSETARSLHRGLSRWPSRRRGRQGQVQLPGDAKSVAAPAKAPTEAVVVQRHEDLTPIGELGKRRIQILDGREVNEQRDRRRERELVLHVAVAEHQSMAVQVEVRHLHGAFRAWLTRTVPFDASAGENGFVERHRFLRVPSWNMRNVETVTAGFCLASVIV